MNTFKYCSGESFYHKLDPRVKLFQLIAASVMIFMIRNILVIIAVLMVVLCIWKIAKLPIRNLFHLLKAFKALFILLIIIQMLFYPGHINIVSPLIPDAVPLIGGHGHITLDGIVHGVMISLRMCVLISLIPLLTTTTETEEIVLGLVKLRLPYRFAYMGTTAMNMVGTFSEEFQTVRNAQLLRACTVFEEGKVNEKLKAYPALIVPLIIGAMRRAQAMGVAMDARSFAARKSRTYIHEISWTKRDTVGIFVIIFFLVGMVLCNFWANHLGIGVM